MSKTMTLRPETGSPKAEAEMDRAQAQLDQMQADMSALTTERIEKTAKPVEDRPLDVEITYNQFKASDAPKITYTRSFPPRGKPIAKEADARRRGWEYVKCIAENYEISGEKIEMWLCKFSGDPMTYWEVPVNKPIYLPRFVAEHLAGRKYHRFKMQDRSQYLVSQDVMAAGTAFGETMVVEESHKRLGCRSAEFEF